MNQREYNYLGLIETFKERMGCHPKHVQVVQVSPTITDIYYEDMSEYHSIRNEQSLFREMKKKAELERKIKHIKPVRPYTVGENHVGRPRNEHYYRTRENYKIIAELHNTCVAYDVEHPKRERNEEEETYYKDLREAWHNKINEFRNAKEF